jgi:anti-sigma regulatory factor (Ser/Thr protein kinase)
VCRLVRWVFDCTTEDVPRARRAVRQVLRAWEVPNADPAREIWGDLELVVGEIAGNAARFCTGRFHMTLEAHRDHVRLVVVDEGSSAEPLRLMAAPPPPEAESGRGLSIVAALSSRCGAEPVPASDAAGGGTRVWAEFAYPSVSPYFTRSCLIGEGEV